MGVHVGHDMCTAWWRERGKGVAGTWRGRGGYHYAIYTARPLPLRPKAPVLLQVWWSAALSLHESERDLVSCFAYICRRCVRMSVASGVGVVTLRSIRGLFYAWAALVSEEAIKVKELSTLKLAEAYLAMG